MKTKNIIFAVAIFLLGFIVSERLKSREAVFSLSAPVRHYVANVVYSG